MLLLVASCGVKPKKNSVFYLNLGGEPSRLNPLSGSDRYTTLVKDYVNESLLETDIETYEWKPKLAVKWKVSKSKDKFTFYLRKNVKWHDGKDFTAEDVKFSFDIIFQDKFNTIARRPYFEGIKEVKIIDSHTVEFIAKDKNWQNFDIAASMSIYPKHFYSLDRKKSFFNNYLNML